MDLSNISYEKQLVTDIRCRKNYGFTKDSDHNEQRQGLFRRSNNHV